MITKISINGEATFKEKVEFSPSLINYIYGFNGSGKTTISKILENPKDYSKCIIETDENDTSEMIVYNKKFVDELFNDSSRLKGIFTLGKDSGDALEIIEKANDDIKLLEKENKGLKDNIQKKIMEKEKIDNLLKESCWEFRKKISEDVSSALTGFSTKEKFKEKCLSIVYDEDSKDYSELLKNYNLLYDKEIKKQLEVENINDKIIQEIEKNEIFKEVIKGNDNTTVAELINKLNNSDWVKQGLDYIEKSGNKCPFCQQELSSNISCLAEYFNKEYEEKCSKLTLLKCQYENHSSSIKNKINDILDNQFNSELDIKLYFEKLINTFNKNIQSIESKIKSPSNIIELDRTDGIIENINEQIDKLNSNIKENNNKLKNINTEKDKFLKDLWNYIGNELDKELSVYKINITNCDKALTPMKDKLSNNEKKISELKITITENEKKITGITESLIEINKILTSFGFDGFKLSDGDVQGTYKIVRPDGEDVGKTLSEGEYRFISFLYYYHLISGSNDSSGITRDKIIVIDDPISSLDSNSLFIVSTLVKKLITECFEKQNGIKQVFVLTHNVYFYKEIVFRGNRDNKKELKEKYFVLSKKNEISSIKEYEKNPIETTYQLLWEELKDDNINKNTCCNTMRRILEYYFNVIGKKDYEKAIDNFDGTDKIVCKSLISCINDNSHYINEEFNIILDEDTVQRYKKVFKEIFMKLGHIEHYNMMMSEEDNNNG